MFERCFFTNVSSWGSKVNRPRTQIQWKEKEMDEFRLCSHKIIQFQSINMIKYAKI